MNDLKWKEVLKIIGGIEEATLLVLPDNSITNAKLANVATDTIKGRVSVGTGDPEDLSVSQVRTLLDIDELDNTSDSDKPVSTAQAAADAAILAAAETYADGTEAAAKSYADGLVVGLWDDRGNFNASINAYPSSGGSGSAGAILKGNIWTISVAGILPTSQVVEPGDTVRALTNTPGNTQANWAIQQNNIGYTPENLANKDASGGYAGLTLFKINFKNALNTFTSFFTNSNTAARTYTFQNRDGTIADDTDLALKNTDTQTHAASSKSTPADADEFPITDSASSYSLKKVLWSAIKATLKTYFDPIYAAIGQSFYIGTTSIAINRTTGSQTLTGVGIDGNAGTATVAAVATALQTARAIDGQNFDGTSAITVIAPGTHAATGKTTPVDADELPLVDSAASNVLKKLTWANLKATLKAYFDTLYGSVTAQKAEHGANTAGISFNSTSLPPSYIPGSIEVNGTVVDINALTTQSLSTNAFLKSSQAFDTNQWYISIMDNLGNKNWLLFAKTTSAVASHTGNITSITVAAGTGTLVAATGTLNGDNGLLILVTGTSGGACDGLYKITSNTVSGTCTFKTSGTTVASGGTYTVYNPVSSITTASPASILNESLNGYYVDATGLNTSSATNARIMGIFSTDGSGNVVAFSTISYGIGAEKNDCYHEVTTSSTRGSSNTQVSIWTTFNYTWGTDLTSTHSSTAGDSWTCNRAGWYEFFLHGAIDQDDVRVIGWMLNSTAINSQDGTQAGLICAVEGNSAGNLSLCTTSRVAFLAVGDVVRVNRSASDTRTKHKAGIRRLALQGIN